MRKYLCAFIMSLMFFSTAAYAERLQVGGRWLVDGAGFAEKGFVRVQLTTQGHIDIKSRTTGNVETITGYDVRGVLNASKLGIKAWKYGKTVNLAVPITLNNFNPTVSEPYRLPSFSVDDLTYTIEFTSARTGTVKIRGYADIETVGRCEINADCAIWKKGSKKPDTDNEGSGCNTGFGAFASTGAAALVALLRRRY